MIALIIQKCMRLISQPKGEDYFTNDISNPLISLKKLFCSRSLLRVVGKCNNLKIITHQNLCYL